MADNSENKPRRRGPGRPAWKPDFEKAEALAQRGLNEKQIAIQLGISVSTLIAKKKQYSEFSAAIERGRINAVSLVANKVFVKAMDGDNACMFFFLKSVGGWRDADPAGGVNVNVNTGPGAVLPGAEAERIEEQKRLIRLLTVPERKEYLRLMRKAAERQRAQARPIEVQVSKLEVTGNGTLGEQAAGEKSE